MDSNERIAAIKSQIEAALNPTHLEILDESAAHLGHAGASTGAGHFAVIIASEKFTDQNLVACHRMIYAAVNEMIGPEIHALRIEIQRK